MSRSVLLAAALLAVNTTPLRAQIEPDPDSSNSQSFWGLSVGELGGEFVTASLRWSALDRHGLDFDGALTTAPRVLVHGVVPLMVSVGPAASVPFKGGILLIRAGAAPVVFAGERLAAWLTGYYGAGLILAKRGSSGVRIDWTRHHLLLGPLHGASIQGVNIVELGFAKSFR